MDGTQVGSSMKQMRDAAAVLNSELSKMPRNTEEFKDKSKKLGEVRGEIRKTQEELRELSKGIDADQIRRDGKEANATLSQMEDYADQLNKELKELPANTADFKQKVKELNDVNKRLDKTRAKVRGVNRAFEGLKNEIRSFGMLALGYLGLQEIAAQIDNLIRRNAELSDSLASVSKTTGANMEAVRALNEEYKYLNTRTARKELNAMARIAGKVGITSRKEIMGFVSAMDKLNIAMGEDLGNPDEVAKKVGKLIDAFKVRDVYGVEQALLKTGSAVNKLGMSSNANEGNIVEFTKRLAGIAPLAELSIENTMGLGATLDNLGQTMEVSGTAMSKLFVRMSKNRDEFYQFARNVDGSEMSLEEFSKLIDTDINKAMMAMLRGVKDNANGMTGLSDTLSKLGLDGGRVISVVGSLANNMDMLAEQQNIARESFREGTSVMKEYEMMNNTMAASLERVRKGLISAFVNSGAQEALGEIIGLLDQWLKNPLSEKISQEQSEVNLLVNSLIRYNDNATVRNELIEEINGKYPSLFENMDLETAKTEDLRDRLKELNAEYNKKLRKQVMKEELEAIRKEELETVREMRELAKQGEELRNRNSELNSPLGTSDMGYKEDQKKINATEEAIKRKQEELDKLARQRAEIEGDLVSAEGPGVVSADWVDDYLSDDDERSNDNAQKPKKPKKEVKEENKEEGDQELTKEEKEQKEQEQFMSDLEELEEKEWAKYERKREIEEEINELRREQTETETERELRLLDEKYWMMQDKAKKHGLDMVKLDKWYADSKEQIMVESGKEQIDQAIKITGTLSDISSQLFTATAQKGNAYLTFAKGLKMAEIYLSTSKTIASAVEKGMAAGPFPANLAHIATGISAGLSFIAQAKSTLGKAQQQPVPAFYEGGYTDNKKPPVGSRDRYGHEFAGQVHKGEYVISANEMKDPSVYNWSKVLEASRLGKAELPDPTQLTGRTNQANSTVSPEILNEVREIKRLMMDQDQTGKSNTQTKTTDENNPQQMVRAYIVREDLIEELLEVREEEYEAREINIDNVQKEVI